MNQSVSNKAVCKPARLHLACEIYRGELNSFQKRGSQTLSFKGNFQKWEMSRNKLFNKSGQVNSD